MPTFSSICGTIPSSGSNIDRHVIAVTAVIVAHGTSTTARSTPRPLNAWCIAIAIASPITSSRATETAVNPSVVQNADQNSESSNAVE